MKVHSYLRFRGPGCDILHSNILIFWIYLSLLLLTEHAIFRNWIYFRTHWWRLAGSG